MSRALLAVWLTVLFLVASPLAAQVEGGPDYAAWERLATQAEDLTGGDEATDEQLATTRAAVVEWRSRFQQAQNTNSGRISTVKEQLDALGPAPAEGESEDEDVAARRSELQGQLSTLQAPRLKAVEAFSRADALVKQIDEITNARQAIELATLSPSPLAPSSWGVAMTDALKLSEGIGGEIGQLTDSEVWPRLRPRLPQAVAYLVVALVLLTYGRSWVQSLPSRMSARASEHSRAVVAFIVSLGQIVLPMVGLYLAIRAIKATGLPGEWTLPFLDALPAAGVILFGGGWLARQLFPARAINYETLNMEDRPRQRARRMTTSLAAVFAIHHVLSRGVLPLSGIYERIGDPVMRVPLEINQGAVSVWHYVLLVVAAVALFRLGKALRTLKHGGAGANQTYRHKTLSVAGLLTRIVVVVAVLIGAMGFINLANMLVWPWTLTLALIGLLVLLQDFIADFFNMVKRGEEGAREGLGPLLIGFALVILSIPLFMVIWGARRTDLAEYWGTFERGFSVSGITISPGGVLAFLLVFGIGYMVTRGVQGALRSSVLPKTRLDAGGQNAVVSGLGYVGIFLAGLLAITSAGIDLSSLAFIAGALGVGIGFGMQNIVSNFVSGIILLIERPISVGDWISAGGQQGIVKRISVRSTQVETFDKTEVIVPNSDLISQPVTNWTRHNQTGRIIIPIGVAYGSDTRKVERILTEIIEDQPIVTIDPPPAVLFRGFGADSLDFEIRAVLSDVTAGLGVTSEVCHQIAERFAAEGIEIPFAQRDIWLRNPEALRGEKAEPKPGPEDDAENQPVAFEKRPAGPPATVKDPRIAFDDADGGDAGPDSGGGESGGDR
ncbi:mechanosensitive ion channel family protein [Paracoccus sp. R12_1]|uniref:DUF3772 domain-containing protein n=1 Tax=unclassified Paracoccus (in: a-proteobacteria) TaxID=2688777 RepID=UPI000C0B9786|nr:MULTISPECIES: DUF3772 domain-containing protein [unclassified Paracoccus (in: a-proteobacteria)]MBO9455388.1 mechanosensitive ion channel family protein [Paracoccus sp. R12_2]MBO9485868.1 mechanosensitive ion channel family protein [Paracoccus sp. R12_1]PHQ69039.1 MAG: mechanosensitive ion channel protein MscS [Paracoccus sp. (in: a-proteobacteria)]